MKPSVLIVNSYGGSLTLAATQEEHPILASLEDHNYGLDSQLLNFPGLPHARWLADWPLDLDLRGAVVLAHPPCSAFSSQNRSKRPDGRGVSSAAFACTTNILDYVLPRQPAAILIESVPGALEGARAVHDHYATRYGYDAYRVLHNAASFGVPQWRRRFWLVLVRQDPNVPHRFVVRLRHNLVRVGNVLDPTNGQNDFLETHTARWNDQLKRFKALGLGEDEVQSILRGADYGGLIGILARHRRLPGGWENRRDFAYRYVTGGKFSSGSLHLLDPNGFAPVLLATAWWWFGQRMLDVDDYKTLMGFPRDYRFHKRRMTLELLSRGVCPPTARWALQQVRQNVFGEAPKSIDVIQPPVEEPVAYSHVELQPGETANVLLPGSTKGKPTGGEKR